MGQQPRGNLFGAGVWVAEEADLVEPLVQGYRKGLDDERAGSVNEDETLHCVAGADELLRGLERDHAAGGPSLVEYVSDI